MNKHFFIVLTYAPPGRAADLDSWYRTRHIPDLLAVPGVVSAARYTAQSIKMPPQVETPDSVAIYGIEADDPMDVIAESGRRMGTERMPSTDALDSRRTIALMATPAHESLPACAEFPFGDQNPVFFAATYSKPGREQELFTCYDDEHVPDLLEIPGMGRVTRCTVRPVKLPADVDVPPTILLHELDPGNPAAVIDEVVARSQAGQIRHTDALDGSKSIVFVLTPTD